jgi:ABC-type polysaccharide/polyol phosphate export permease
MTKEMPVPFYDSAKQKNAAIDELIQLVRYKDLVMHLVRRDVTSRYKRSVLGVAWTMLNPLGMMLILSVVFSQVFASTTVGYPAYILSGLLVWNFFAQSSISGINSLVWGGDLFRRIYFPRSVFALAAVGTGIVNLFLSLVPFVVVSLFVGIYPTVNFFFVLIPVLLIAMFTLGLSLIIASVGIRFPDIVEMYNVILLAWMYLTPIIYPKEIIPEQFLGLVQLNPMFPLVELFRQPIFDGVSLDPQLLGVCTLISVITLFAGWMLFSRMTDEIAYSS